MESLNKVKNPEFLLNIEHDINTLNHKGASSIPLDHHIEDNTM